MNEGAAPVFLVTLDECLAFRGRFLGGIGEVFFDRQTQAGELRIDGILWRRKGAGLAGGRDATRRLDPSEPSTLAADPPLRTIARVGPGAEPGEIHGAEGDGF